MDIEAEFGCEDTVHPLTICALDTAGGHWWLDGDYQLQHDYTYNEHPVWHKESVYLLTYFLFLHSGNHTHDWYWAITSDPTFQSDQSIMAYCITGGDGVGEPSDCPIWVRYTHCIAMYQCLCDSVCLSLSMN